MLQTSLNSRHAKSPTDADQNTHPECDARTTGLYLIVAFFASFPPYFPLKTRVVHVIGLKFGIDFISSVANSRTAKNRSTNVPRSTYAGTSRPARRCYWFPSSSTETRLLRRFCFYWSEIISFMSSFYGTGLVATEHANSTGKLAALLRRGV